MSAHEDAVANAARLLRLAENGYARTYGSVPLDARVELAGKWIDLARVTQDPTPTDPKEEGR